MRLDKLAIRLMCAGFGALMAMAVYAVDIAGTGGSAATRVLAQWSFATAKEHAINVRYASAVSDVGIREIKARRVDFATSEIPLAAAELKAVDLVQFPLLIGGVTPVVNIPGIKSGQLKLNADLIAKLYMGKIRSWDDAELRALNPGVTLPRLPVVLVARDEPASTTLAFTTHLANNSPAFRAAVGASKQPGWTMPLQRVSSTQAMGEKVRATEGAIGYINYDEAYRNQLSVVRLQNRAGNFVLPTQESFQIAAMKGGIARAGDQLPMLVDIEGADAWPIVYVTYVLLDRRPQHPERASATLRFFYQAFLKGDAMAAETGFVPLPASLQARIVGRFRDVLGPDNAPLDFLH